MLNNIKLAYFRKHIDASFDLLPGLMALRGGNEEGKSTILEAIAYALGSVKFLREPLEDVVTYYKEGGSITHREPVNSLKVVLNLTLGGVEYVIKRGKSGAELTYDGGRVTGQNEVTKFIFEKMGVDPGAASRLMFANQGEIRGALESKDSKATMELIERLAEFDQIDTLIERIQANLTLGSSDQIETDLQRAEERLAELMKVEAPDFAALELAVTNATGKVEGASQLAGAADERLAKERATLDLARQRESAFTTAESNLLAARERFAKACRDLDAAKVAANKEYVHRPEADIAKDIDDLVNASQHMQAYARIAKYLVAPPEVVECDRGTLAQEIENESAKLETAAAAVNSNTRKIDLAKAQISAGSCSFCGQDFSDLPAVAEKNAALQAEIDAATVAKAEAAAEVERASLEVRTLRALKAESDARFTVLEAHPDHLKRVGDTLPPTLEWIGPDIASLQGAEDRLAKVRAELAQVRSDERAAQAAQARVQALEEQRQAEDVAVARAATDLDLAQMGRMDIAHATTLVNVATEAQRAAADEATQAQLAQRDAQYALRDAQRDFEQSVKARQAAEDSIAKLQDSLKTLKFNNALLKRVRQCRPLIADKLWGVVLNAVSTYFSEMRGDKSQVTKDTDGFKVDGASVAGLSGSAKDILGLAIRAALVRMFLPNSPFMILDEPCAAMDAARTEATLGFIVGCGFKQVLLVTHEDISETVADHLVQL